MLRHVVMVPSLADNENDGGGAGFPYSSYEAPKAKAASQPAGFGTCFNGP